MRYNVALIALAVICLLAAPALSAPQDKGVSKHDGYRFSAGNLTEAQMNNMTIGELEKMRSQGCANASMNGSCEFRNNQSGNGSRYPGEPRAINDGSDGKRAFHGSDHYGSTDGAMLYGGPRSNGSPLLLLMGDITADKLGNMTLNQIKALKLEKMNELNNMTLGQIKTLEQKKMQERNNMTTGELVNKGREQREVARIIGFAQLAGHDGLLNRGSLPYIDAERVHGQGRMARYH
jgi:hypothetical protein